MSGITVVLCTYNRVHDLERCLRALILQDLPDENLQILVVDNNSTDATRQCIDSFARRRSSISYVFAAKQGLAHARNVGLSEAKFDFCAFTDDDAIPAPSWAGDLLRAFESLPSDTVAIGGEIKPIFEIEPPSWLNDDMLRALSAKLGWSNNPKFCGPYEWLCEANSAYRRTELLHAGAFPEELGRVGTNLLSGENAVNFILSQKGGKFFFDPRIIVEHSIPKNRLTKEWFRRRYFWQGVTTYIVKDYLRKHDIFQAPWSPLIVPCSESAWMTTFNEENDQAFPEALNSLSNLGYLLASQQCIGGR